MSGTWGWHFHGFFLWRRIVSEKSSRWEVSITSRDDADALDLRPPGVELAQPCRHWPNRPVADDAVIDLRHSSQLAHCAGAKDFVGLINIFHRQEGFALRNLFRGANLKHSRARDPGRA